MVFNLDYLLQLSKLESVSVDTIVNNIDYTPYVVLYEDVIVFDEQMMLEWEEELDEDFPSFVIYWD